MKANNLIRASLLAVSVFSLTACGFALRGVGTNSQQLAPAYHQVTISTADDSTAYAFKYKLETRLSQLGVNSTSDAAQQIRIDNLRYRRYELLGILTEVRLLLMADVTYQVDGKTHSYPIQVERSYQYNQGTVATSDQQGEQAQNWLQNNLAERIAEQYYALATQSGSKGTP